MLRSPLAEWPLSRAFASAKRVPQLAGFPMHISIVVRSRSFFVHAFLASITMPHIAAGDDFAGRMVNPGRRVGLRREFRNSGGNLLNKVLTCEPACYRRRFTILS